MFNKMVILGCGLIGCSVAGAAKKKGVAKEIIGVETHNLDVVEQLNFFDDVKSSILEVNQADFVVISTPISSLADIFNDLVNQHFIKNFGLITDVLSTKKSLIESISCLSHEKKTFFCESFLSSHPLAGSEKKGAISADVSMFEKSKVLICPFNIVNEPDSSAGSECKKEKKLIELLEKFWDSLGCIPSTLPINQHDLFFAEISHFPHLVSFCLAMGLSRSNLSSKTLSLHGGGLRDTTRIAGAPADLWADIIFDNKVEIINLIQQWSINWNELTEALKTSDKVKFKKCLVEASNWRNNFENK